MAILSQLSTVHKNDRKSTILTEQQQHAFNWKQSDVKVFTFLSSDWFQLFLDQINSVKSYYLHQGA